MRSDERKRSTVRFARSRPHDIYDPTQGNPNSMPERACYFKSGPISIPEQNLLCSKIMGMANETATLRGWRKLPDNRIGHALFSLGMVARVPYFGTVLPTVTALEPGRCEVTAPKWFGIHNHLHTFHAIAACNLAEVAMGMLSEATVPTSHRWIPKAMNVQYLAKAETGLRAIAELAEIPDFASITEGRELVVPIRIVDKAGTEVVHADITTWITPK